MPELFLFTPPRFTARSVARAVGKHLSRKLTYQQPDDPREALDQYSHGARR